MVAHGVPAVPASRGRDALPLLLYGVTGSGKTEVYLQAIAHVLEQGRGAIVLVPEIALTPQTVQRFASRFGSRVAVLHSALGDGERFDEWHRIRSGEARVAVGPRSAIFAPVNNLGIIIVDEEHEPSYKQDESPHYHARDVAVMRGHFEHCTVVLGTATPSMETWLNVQKGKYRMAHLSARVAGRPMPHVQVVDMRLGMSGAGHARIFSEELLDALKLRLERGEQSILFLNRRGYSNSLTCPSCGAAAACDKCSVSYTYHRDDDCLRCHVCGGWRLVPDKCLDCGDPAFRYAGFGTQRVEQALQRCFPKARVLRMDTDITTRKHSHDEILGRFKSGHADILGGTQMIAKGLDFPNVTLVGVLAADMSLHIPDFRAGERTYQLLAQVSGRAGRDELPGEVFVQTFSPDHPAVEAAADGGFETFAAQELAERRRGGYPPYTHLVSLGFKGVSEERVKYAATLFARELAETAGNDYIVSDAYPAPLAKAKGLYRYQVILRATTTRLMTRPLRALLQRKLLPPDVTLAIDVDAVNLG
jgi:primosomal protein N' (replication factor Y)